MDCSRPFCDLKNTFNVREIKRQLGGVLDSSGKVVPGIIDGGGGGNNSMMGSTFGGGSMMGRVEIFQEELNFS
jgi:hypothetical protein